MYVRDVERHVVITTLERHIVAVANNESMNDIIASELGFVSTLDESSLKSITKFQRSKGGTCVSDSVG